MEIGDPDLSLILIKENINMHISREREFLELLLYKNIYYFRLLYIKKYFFKLYPICHHFCVKQ